MKYAKIEYTDIEEPYFICPYCGEYNLLTHEDSEGDIVSCEGCEEDIELTI